MQLDFDIIALLILFLSIIFAYARGFIKQLKMTLSISIPFIFILVFKKLFLQLVNKLSFMDSFLTKVVKVLDYFTQINVERLKVLIAFLAMLLASFIVIELIFRFIVHSKKRNILAKKTNSSRFIALGLGIIRGIALAVVILLLLQEVTYINYQTPITKLIVDFFNPLLTNIGGL